MFELEFANDMQNVNEKGDIVLENYKSYDKEAEVLKDHDRKTNILLPMYALGRTQTGTKKVSKGRKYKNAQWLLLKRLAVSSKCPSANYAVFASGDSSKVSVAMNKKISTETFCKYYSFD